MTGPAPVASFWRWAAVLVPGIVVLSVLSGFLANSGPGNAWFAGLLKPRIYPPPTTFGVVWTILYVMMGVALALIVTSRAPQRRLAIIAFVAQLLLNLAWSPLFFADHNIAAALALLAVLDVAVVGCAILFWRVRPLAGALLLPYFAWSLFATALNWQFLVFNPAR